MSGGSVLVVGSGGREHALARALARTADRVETAPGNPGTAELGPVHDLDADDPVAVADLAERLAADLVVIGPEAPLVAGAADELRRRGVPVFGPDAAAARLEGSKAFAKQVMEAAGVPTGAHVATSDRATAHQALERFAPPYVVKADGLAAGKGVRICASLDDARTAIDDALVREHFGAAGTTVVVEEHLAGPERSVFGVCDGNDVVLLQPAQDHKRALDGDRGPNTGGMGAFTPVPGFGPDRVDPLADLVFRPVLAELRRRGAPFRGLLYAGLVDTVDGPEVLEFNVRFGDPETQAVLPVLESDLVELLGAAATGSVAGRRPQWSPDAVVTVVLASAGYPGDYETGVPITGVAEAERIGAQVVHAGTARDADGRLVTAGGRVLAVTGRGPDLAAARDHAYDAAHRIRFAGRHLRRDIGTPSPGT